MTMSLPGRVGLEADKEILRKPLPALTVSKCLELQRIHMP